MAIAESLAVAGLRVIASPAMKKLIDKGFSYVGMDVPSELKDLVDIYLPRLVIATTASEETAIGMPRLKAWLQRLKCTYDEAEDILDEIEYQTIAKKIKHENRKFMVRATSLPLIKPLAEFTKKNGKKFSFLSSYKRKLWFRLNKLKIEVKGLIEVAKDLYAVRNQPNATPVGETSSNPQNNIFVGRDREHKLVVDELLQQSVPSENKSCSVVAIVGIGGAGKTTLAQHIYKDDKVAKNFDLRMWVSLARKMDVTKHTKAMIESATSGKVFPQSSTLDALQCILLELLSQSKRVFVVLDDLWYNRSQEDNIRGNDRNEDEDWERLFAPLNSTNGSKVILLTSRSKIFPRILQRETKCFVNMGELRNDDSMSLFRHHACLDNMAESPLKNELEEVSVQIVQKLSQFPLAIKSVASQLSGTRDVNKWKDILKGNNLKELTTTLMWSYQQLDKELQRCFILCSIFPKGFMFSKLNLFPMWLALNYISFSDNKNVEDTGYKYFDELVSRFFFQHSKIENGRSYFTMHDAFHDLAENLTREECFRIEDEQVVEIPSTVHHLSIVVRNFKEHVPNICKLERLRTLIFCCPLDKDSNNNLDEILKKLKKLRILILVLSPSITQLPKTVCELKYLKLLSFCWSSITQVPNVLCSLHLLRILELPIGIADLPKHMSNLRNLRHIYVKDKEDRCLSRHPPIRDVGKIASLQDLPVFHVRKEKGYEFQQLGNLRELKGDLLIADLANVSNKDEASEAKIKDKNILGLGLVWSEDSILRISDFETIEALQPPKYVKDLRIIGYSADRYPTWLEDESIRYVHWLRLHCCNFLKILPSNFHLWKYCEEIALFKLRNLKELTEFPPCLKQLIIDQCPSLVLISEEELIIFNKDEKINQLLLEKEFVLTKVATILELMCMNYDLGVRAYLMMMHNECEAFQQIGKLTERDLSKELKILDCAQGNALPLSEDQLHAWWNCHQERVKFIYTGVHKARQFELPSSITILSLHHCNITDRALSDCLKNLCSLQHLTLIAIMSLVSLPLEETMLQLSRLRILTMSSCLLLRSLGGLQKLYLEKFDIEFCPCLEFKSEQHDSPLPSSIQWLTIIGCTIASGTFSGQLPKLSHVDLSNCHSSAILSVDKLTSLTFLRLTSCPDIHSLSGLHLLQNLKELRLIFLPKLKVEDQLQSWPCFIENLHTDNLQMLKIFSSKMFVPPKKLALEYLQEEIFTSEDLSLLNSLELLGFFDCKIKSMPTNFTNLSSLRVIQFEDCPYISQLPQLPQLPKSVQAIKITGCHLLKERCQHNGEDWPKIADIDIKDIN